jgi:cell division protein YceG involved in septum cleavage
MRKVFGKSVILGIGIGMIITAIAGMIFSAGTQKELSKDEIINLAKGYGLIEPVQILNDEGSSSSDSKDAKNTSNTSSAADSTKAEEKKADNTAAGTSANSTPASSTSTKSNINERNIVINIKSGSKAENIIEVLFEKKVISDKKQFASVLNSYKASRKIIRGTYKFKENEDYKYIVKTICNLN